MKLQLGCCNIANIKAIFLQKKKSIPFYVKLFFRL